MNKQLQSYSFCFIALQLMILLGSWGAWYIASKDPSLLYLSLKSYFIPFKLDTQSILEQVNYFPAWKLTLRSFEAGSIYKTLDEILTCLIIIFYTCLFIYGIAKKEFLKKISIKELTILSLTVSFLACLAFPGDSSDIYGYIARGTQQLHYQMNPYKKTVSKVKVTRTGSQGSSLMPEFKSLEEINQKYYRNWRGDPLLTNTHWSKNPSPYGPLFMLWASMLVALSMGNLFLCLFLFKLTNLVVFFLALYYLHRFLYKDHAVKELSLKSTDLDLSFLAQNPFGEWVGRIFAKGDSELSKKIFYLTALNPFIIVEVFWNGHNDIYMFTLIFLAIYYAWQGKYNRAILFVALSALIKYLSLALLPLIFLFAFLDETKKMQKNIGQAFLSLPWAGLFASAIITLMLVRHYDLWVIHSEKISHNLILSHKSLFDVFNSLSHYLSGEDLPALFKYIFLLGYVVFYAWFLWQLVKQPFSKKNIWKYSFWILFTLICVASPKFHSWYILMFLPLGICTYPMLMLLLCLTHLLSLTMLDQVNILNFSVMTALPLVAYFKRDKLLKTPT